MTNETKKTKHTPGPWRVSFRTVVTDTSDTLNVPVAKVFSRDNRELSDGEREANAHLFAAAPDLLALAEAIREAADSPMSSGKSGTTRPTEKQWLAMVNGARAAIVKAGAR